MPGTKLAEQQIADIFKVSRTLVRQALNQLSRDRLVTLEPARGAFVAHAERRGGAPGLRGARRCSRPRWCGGCARGSPTRRSPSCARTCSDEREAVARTDVSGRTRLLADFHVVLARMLGNEVLAQLLADLLSRSSLIALMYQSSHSAEHSHAEHVAIVDALERRDARAAVRLMEEHLAHVERNLRLDPRTAPTWLARPCAPLKLTAMTPDAPRYPRDLAATAATRRTRAGPATRASRCSSC